MKGLNKFTFAQQWWLAFGIMLCCAALATFLKQGIFANLGWMLAGLLFILHPVCPEMAKWRYRNDEERMKRDFRIAGAVIFAIGLMIRFGV